MEDVLYGLMDEEEDTSNRQTTLKSASRLTSLPRKFTEPSRPGRDRFRHVGTSLDILTLLVLSFVVFGFLVLLSECEPSEYGKWAALKEVAPYRGLSIHVLSRLSRHHYTNLILCLKRSTLSYRLPHTLCRYCGTRIGSIRQLETVTRNHDRPGTCRAALVQLCQIGCVHVEVEIIFVKATRYDKLLLK